MEILTQLSTGNWIADIAIYSVISLLLFVNISLIGHEKEAPKI